MLNLLDPSTNQFDNAWHNFQPEMSDDQYYNFLVWHRGLSIPRARDLNREEVQRGKEVFTEIGCTTTAPATWSRRSCGTPTAKTATPTAQRKNFTIFPRPTAKRS